MQFKANPVVILNNAVSCWYIAYSQFTGHSLLRNLKIKLYLTVLRLQQMPALKQDIAELLHSNSI